MKSLAAVMFLAAVLTGCTDAQRAKLGALGDPAHIVCYSGGQKIYEGNSTGKVSSGWMAQTDGYYFNDARDNKLKEVSGDCVVTYGTAAQVSNAAQNQR